MSHRIANAMRTHDGITMIFPWFKLFPGDWLSSEAVCDMNLCQQGAYMRLLCFAWLNADCTIPADEGKIRSLLSQDIADLTPILTCFPLHPKQPDRRYNKRLMEERKQVMTRSEKAAYSAKIRWDKPAKTKPAPSAPKPKQTDTEWFNALRTNPLYDHIDLDREFTKMDQWLAGKPGRKKTRSFILNWLNKIEAPVSNGHGGLTCADCHKVFTDPAALKTHRFAYHPKWEG